MASDACMNPRIAIDCMGGDHGPDVTVPAALAFARSEPSVSLLLVGDESLLRARLGALESALAARIEVRHADEVVTMDEAPASALRSKRRSSMRLAIEAVKAGDAQACVSAGNTGALMAISRFVLKMLDGIDRPAIAAPLPNQRGGATTMLDLGANVDCEPQHYLQFAIMGAALATAVEGKAAPTIGLLNIGEELIKGNETVRQAADLLRASSLDFRGNVEGNDIFEGTTDVVVCDGFVGNVALKTSEGLARMIGGFIREEYSRGFASRLAGAISLPVLGRLRRRLDHRRYNGASLVGLRGVVIKSHGSADALAFEQALRRAHEAVRNQLLERIAQAVARISAEAPKVGS
jgi:glycerol-3-phosphate acyltransferase PlsX